MIDVMHIDKDAAVRTAAALIEALGDGHELSKLWIIALRKEFGLIYQAGSDPVRFSRPV